VVREPSIITVKSTAGLEELAVIAEHFVMEASLFSKITKIYCSYLLSSILIYLLVYSMNFSTTIAE
jgi:hypothetical protein